MGMFFRSHTASPYIKELYGNSDEDFVNDVKGLIKMNTDSIKSKLIEYFNNGNIKFFSYLDVGTTKQISAKVIHPELNIVKVVNLNVFAQENSVTFELIADDMSITKTNDTYDSDLGIAFTQWFKPILRNIVNGKYELEGDVISDELMGTDYCQVRENGILLFNNFSEMIEFAIWTQNIV